MEPEFLTISDNVADDWATQNAPTEAEPKFQVEDAKQTKALEYLENLDLLPMVVDLVEGVSSGRISVKDMHNTAGPIRAKLAAAARYLKDLEYLDVPVDKRVQSIELLLEKNKRKKKLLQRFQSVMEIKPAEIEAARRNSKIKEEQEPQQSIAATETQTQTQTAPDIPVKDEHEDMMEIDSANVS